MSRISVLPSQAPTGFGSATWANEPPSEAERAKVKCERNLIKSILNNDLVDFNKIFKDHSDIIDLNFESSGKMTPLHTAMAYGRVEMVESLLSRKADIHAQNSLGFTPLVSAVHNGHEQCVQLGLLAGSNKLIKTFKGETAVEIAKEKGFMNILNLLQK